MALIFRLFLIVYIRSQKHEHYFFMIYSYFVPKTIYTILSRLSKLLDSFLISIQETEGFL